MNPYQPDRGSLSRIALWVGSAGLLMAMTIDTCSVLARQMGFVLPGNIELIQPCITAAIAAALVLATLQQAHAAVHLFTSHMTPAWRQRLGWLGGVATTVALALLAAGCCWIAIELWPLDERSDLLQLPIAPARWLWCGALALAALLEAWRCARRLIRNDTDV